MSVSEAARTVAPAIGGLLQPTGCGEYVRRRRVSGVVNGLCRAGGLVIDVGGGPGRLGSALRPDLRPGYVVADMAPGPHGRRVIADVMGLPWRDAAADIVCLSDVLEHVADDVSAVREGARVLRPGGHLVVHVPSLRPKPLSFVRRAAEEAEEADHQRFPHVRDGYDAAALCAVVGRAGGLEPVTVEPSFTAVQSLVSDLDGYLWWRRVTAARIVPWLLVRLASLGHGVPPEPSSSGLLGVFRRIPGREVATASGG